MSIARYLFIILHNNQNTISIVVFSYRHQYYSLGRPCTVCVNHASTCWTIVGNSQLGLWERAARGHWNACICMHLWVVGWLLLGEVKVLHQWRSYCPSFPYHQWRSHPETMLAIPKHVGMLCERHPAELELQTISSSAVRVAPHVLSPSMPQCCLTMTLKQNK